jgi:hypothetical protein
MARLAAKRDASFLVTLVSKAGHQFIKTAPALTWVNDPAISAFNQKRAGSLFVPNCLVERTNNSGPRFSVIHGFSPLLWSAHRVC